MSYYRSPGYSHRDHVVSRITKILLAAVVGLIAIVGVVALAAHLLISRQDHELFKRELASRIRASTGFELTINGPLELPYSLLPTVVLEDIVLNNPDFGGQRNLLEAKELRISFAALPLLRGEVLVYESSISFVDMNLEVSKDGRSNWISDEAADRSTLNAIAVHQVDANDIRLSYRNLQTGVEYGGRIDELNLQEPELNYRIEIDSLAELSDTPIEISGRMGSLRDMLSGNHFPIDLHIDIHDVDIEVNGQIDRIEDGEISSIQVQLAAEGGDLREIEKLVGATVPETESFSAVMVLSMLDEAVSASNVFAEVSWLGSELELAGDIADLFDLAGIDIAARVSGEDLPDISAIVDVVSLPGTDSYELSGTVRGDWPSIGISEAQASLSRSEVTLDAAGVLGDIANLDGLDVTIDVRGRDLRDLSPIVGEELPPTRTYNFSGRLEGAWPAISLSAADVELTRDNLVIDLSGEIDNLPDLSGIYLNVVANGRNLSSVPELSLYDPPSVERFELEGRIVGSASRLDVEDLEAVLAQGEHQLTLSGTVDAIPEFGGMDLKLTATGTDPSQLDAMLGLDLPSMQSYRLSATVTGEPDTFRARDVVFEGTAPGVRLDLKGDIGRVPDLQDVDLALRTTVAGLSSMNPYLGSDLPESETIELRGRLTGSVPDFDLEEFTLQSGETLVMGSAGLRTGERPLITGSVSSGVVDLRAFLVGVEEQTGPTEESRSGRRFSDEPFDLSYLDMFDAQFSLDNLELLAFPENAQVEHATIALKQGTLAIDPIELKRSDTTITGHFVLDRRAAPEFDADLTMENIDLATFLQDIRRREIYEGRFDLTLELRSRGSSVSEVMANLNGHVAAFVSEARIPDTNLPLRSVDLFLGLLPWLKRQEEMVVNCAIGQLDIVDGFVDVELLYLDSLQSRMVGGGTVDLRTEELKLRLSPRPTRQRFLAHNIDVAVTGPLTEPRFSSVGRTKSAATFYAKYALFGPLGLLVPTELSRKHPCVGSLQEYRQQRAEQD